MEQKEVSIEARSFRSFALNHDNAEYRNLSSLPDLCELMVGSNAAEHFPLLFRLIKLILTLPVSTASVERVFSAVKILKTRLRTKISDEWFLHLTLIYVEKELLQGISNEVVVSKFKEMFPGSRVAK